jgi:hypothetical protein
MANRSVRRAPRLQGQCTEELKQCLAGPERFRPREFAGTNVRYSWREYLTSENSLDRVAGVSHLVGTAGVVATTPIPGRSPLMALNEAMPPAYQLDPIEPLLDVSTLFARRRVLKNPSSSGKIPQGRKCPGASPRCGSSKRPVGLDRQSGTRGHG